MVIKRIVCKKGLSTMKNMLQTGKRKILAVLLVVVLLCGVLPLSVWAANDMHTVHFSLNYRYAEKLSDQKVKNGETASWVDGERDGWYFCGWSLEKRGALYDFATPVTKDITLYAQWRQNKSVAAAFAAAGMTAGKSNDDETPVEDDPEFVLPEDSSYYFIMDVLHDTDEEADGTFYVGTWSSSGVVGSSHREIYGRNQVCLRFSIKEGAEIYMIRKADAGSEPCDLPDEIVEAALKQGTKQYAGVATDFYTLKYMQDGGAIPDENRFYVVCKYDGKYIVDEMLLYCYEPAWILRGAERKGTLSTSDYIEILTAMDEDTSSARIDNYSGKNIEFDMSPWYNILINGRGILSSKIEPLAAGENYFSILISEDQTVNVVVNCPSDTAYVNPYSDVTTASQYYNSIAFCSQNGYMSGVSANTFDMTANVTNAMLATVLYKSAGSPAVEHDGAEWYSAAMAWMVKNGLFANTDVQANDPVTRYALAYAMYQYKMMEDPTFNYIPSGAYFLHDMEGGEESSNIMSLALSAGLLEAQYAEKLPVFNPDGGVTRGELARAVASLHQVLLYATQNYFN